MQESKPVKHPSHIGEATMSNTDQFYLQDSRTYVGNDMLFWAKGGQGYTTDLSKAEVYTKEQVVKQNQCRETDIPWPKEYIDSKTRPAVDMQYTCKQEALKDTGIKLAKPYKPKLPKHNNRCHHCGKFIKDIQQYEPCPHCGGDNMP